MKLLFTAIATAALLMPSNPAEAEMVATFNYSGTPAVTPAILSPISGVTVSNMSLGNTFGTLNNPVLNNAASSTGYAGASGGAYHVNLFQTGALDLADGGSGFLTFDIANASGGDITLDDFDFGSRREARGPQEYSFRTGPGFGTELASDTIGGAGNWFLKDLSFTSVLIADGTTASFRLYGFNGNPAAGGAEFARFDDLTATIGATAIPEPSSMAFVGLGLAGAAWLRRRNRNLSSF